MVKIKWLLGLVLIVIGIIVLFTTIVDQTVGLEGYTVKQAKEVCDSWVGDLGKAFSETTREDCGTVDFLYYGSFGVV